MHKIPARYDLLPRRRVVGYFAAVFAGAGATTIFLTGAQAALMVGAIFFERASVGSGPFLSFFPILMFTFVIASAVWAVGGLLALPLWFALHRVGWKGPISAVLAGAGLVTTTYLLLLAPLAPSVTGTSSPDDVLTILVWTSSAVAMGVFTGGTAGYALWRVAYRRTDAGADPS